MKTRRYCWRVGLAWEQEDGTVCQECGAPWGREHINMYDRCGAYVRRQNNRYGQHCSMKAGHEGPHQWEERV